MITRKKVLVIGDVMLDTYFTGEVKRISPEAPVPVFRKMGERSVLGGAANVAVNLVAAGHNVFMMSIVGKDETGERLLDTFYAQGINTDLVMSINRHTTEKTRFLASNNQQVLRLDVEDTQPLSNEACIWLLEKFKVMVKSFDMILISDYLKGLLTYEFTQGIIQISRENHIPVIIDVKDPMYEKYAQATLIKPNLKEVRELTKMKARTDAEIIEASEMLRIKCDSKYVCTNYMW